MDSDISALQHQATRHLQEIAAALSEALTPTQVAEVFLNQGVSRLGAGAGTVVLLNDSQMLEIIGAIGYAAELSRRWQQFSVDLPVPLARAVKTGRPIWIESAREWQENYPAMTLSSDQWNAWASLPLIAKKPYENY